MPVLRSTLLICIALTSLALACDAEEPCGDGIPKGSTDGSTPSTGGTSTNGIDGSTGALPPSYQDCPSGSTVECDGSGQFCAPDLLMCSSGCASDLECLPPMEGDAIPLCASVDLDTADGQVGYSGLCVLTCGNGGTCPTGMVCEPFDGCEDCVTPICQWP